MENKIITIQPKSIDSYSLDNNIGFLSDMFGSSPPECHLCDFYMAEQSFCRFHGTEDWEPNDYCSKHSMLTQF